MAEKPNFSVVPVYDQALEAGVLNRLINERTAPLQVMHLLTEDCFYINEHGAIFRAIARLYAEGREIDMLSVADELRNTLHPDVVASIMTATAEKVFAANELMELDRMVLRLQEYAIRRKLGLVVPIIMNLHSDMTVPLLDGIKEVHETLDKIVMGSPDSFVTLHQKLDDLLQVIADNQNEEKRHTGLLCGLPQIDHTGGLPSDGLVVIGAKSSHGKTTFATSIALHALKAGQRVAFYSMEMSMQKVTSRIVAMECGVSSNAIQRLRLPASDLERVRDAIARLQESVARQFYFDNRNIRDLDALVMSIRSLQKQHGLDCVVVDYLQLMNASAGARFENTTKLLGGIAHRLHEVAQELGITILLLSQINRAVTGEPFMMHLRDSGEIAEAADMVIILYNADFEHAPLPRPYERIDPKGLILVKVEKNRDGSTSQFLAGFCPEENRIFGVEKVEEEDRQPRIW